VAVSAKLRWKRYINELRFVNEEVDFVREISKDAASEFQIYYEKYCAKRGIDIESLNRKHGERVEDLYKAPTDDGSADDNPQLDSEPDSALILHEDTPEEPINSEKEEQYEKHLSEYQMTQDELEIHDAFNKVFRKLAMILHPDKIANDSDPAQREEKLKMFKDAKDALEKRKYFVLLDIAEKFNVSTPRNYKQQIRWMKKEIAMLNNVLGRETKTYNYMFSECETEQERDILIKRFITQLFGPEVFNT
jgi:hypothetical protein